MPDPKNKKPVQKSTSKEVKAPLKYLPLPEKGMAAESTGYVRQQTTGKGEKLTPSIPEKVSAYMKKNQEAFETLGSKERNKASLKGEVRFTGPSGAIRNPKEIYRDLRAQHDTHDKISEANADIGNQKFVEAVVDTKPVKYIVKKVQDAEDSYKANVRPGLKNTIGEEKTKATEQFLLKHGGAMTSAAAMTIGTALRLKPGATSKIMNAFSKMKISDDIPVVSNSLFSLGKRAEKSLPAIKRAALDVDLPENVPYIKTAKAKATRARNANPGKYPEPEVEIDEDALFKSKYSGGYSEPEKIANTLKSTASPSPELISVPKTKLGKAKEIVKDAKELGRPLAELGALYGGFNMANKMMKNSEGIPLSETQAPQVEAKSDSTDWDRYLVRRQRLKQTSQQLNSK